MITLFIYVNVKSLDRPEVQAFVDFYLSPAARRAIRSTGYVELPDEAYRIGQGLVAALANDPKLLRPLREHYRRTFK